MATLSARVEFKTIKQAMGQHRHNDRSKVPSYSDPSLIEANKTLQPFPTEIYTKRNGDEVVREVKLRSMADDIEERYKEQMGRKWQSNSCHFIDGILSFSTDADLENKNVLDECALNTMKAIIEKHELRVDALIELVRHEDETRTHYHFLMMNQRLNTTSARRSFDKDACIALQDLAGEQFASMDIHRGVPKQERIDNDEPMHKYLNRSVKQLHEDLPKELAAAEAELERCEAKTIKAEGALDRVQTTTKHAEKKLDRVQLKTMDADVDLEQLIMLTDNTELEHGEADKLMKAAQEEEVIRLKALNDKLCKESSSLNKEKADSLNALERIQSTETAKQENLNRIESEVAAKQAQVKNLDEQMRIKPLELKPEVVEVVVKENTFSTDYEDIEVYKADTIKDYLNELEVKTGIAEDEAYSSKQKASKLEDIAIDKKLTDERNEELTTKLSSTKDKLQSTTSELDDAQSHIALMKEISDELGIDMQSEIMKRKGANVFSSDNFKTPS